LDGRKDTGTVYTVFKTCEPARILSLGTFRICRAALPTLNSTAGVVHTPELEWPAWPPSCSKATTGSGLDLYCTVPRHINLAHFVEV
jgi:hypothetical protein